MAAAKLKGGLRVHVAPVGFYLDRVWEVPLRNSADRLWLIVEEGSTSNEAPYRAAIRRHIGRRIEVREEPTKVWVLDDLLRSYGKILRLELDQGNEVWVNISTGSKLGAIAGALAAMSHGVHAYYVVARDHKIALGRRGSTNPVPLSSGVSGVIPLPDYRLDRPAPEAIQVLRAIREATGSRGGEVKKRDLVKRLLHEGWENEIETKNGDKTQAGLMRLNRILEGLEKPPKKVEQTGRTRRRRISLTDEGWLLLTLMG